VTKKHITSIQKTVYAGWGIGPKKSGKGTKKIREARVPWKIKILSKKLNGLIRLKGWGRRKVSGGREYLSQPEDGGLAITGYQSTGTILRGREKKVIGWRRDRKEEGGARLHPHKKCPL